VCCVERVSRVDGDRSDRRSPSEKCSKFVRVRSSCESRRSRVHEPSLGAGVRGLDRIGLVGTLDDEVKRRTMEVERQRLPLLHPLTYASLLERCWACCLLKIPADHLGESCRILDACVIHAECGDVRTTRRNHRRRRVDVFGLNSFKIHEPALNT